LIVKRLISAVTADDFKKIPMIIKTADKIEADGKNDKGMDIIKYTKQINGQIVVVKEVRTGRNQLAFLSIRKHPAAKDAADAAPLSTVDTDGGHDEAIQEFRYHFTRSPLGMYGYVPAELPDNISPDNHDPDRVLPDCNGL
jgi:hypothetical protein